MTECSSSVLYFFCNAPATPVSYTLSLHDALPIWSDTSRKTMSSGICATFEITFTTSFAVTSHRREISAFTAAVSRSEEHTSELQSRRDLVCRLLLEKKKKKTQRNRSDTATISATY